MAHFRSQLASSPERGAPAAAERHAAATEQAFAALQLLAGAEEACTAWKETCEAQIARQAEASGAVEGVRCGMELLVTHRTMLQAACCGGEPRTVDQLCRDAHAVPCFEALRGLIKAADSLATFMAALVESVALMEVCTSLGGSNWIRDAWRKAKIDQDLRQALVTVVREAATRDGSALAAAAAPDEPSASSVGMGEVEVAWPTEGALRPKWPHDDRPGVVLAGAHTVVAIWDAVVQGCVSLRQSGCTGSIVAAEVGRVAIEEYLCALDGYGELLDEAAQRVPGEASMERIPLLLASMALLRSSVPAYEGLVQCEVRPSQPP